MLTGKSISVAAYAGNTWMVMVQNSNMEILYKYTLVGQTMFLIRINRSFSELIAMNCSLLKLSQTALCCGKMK